MTSHVVPELDGDALKAVLHRRSHLQIIASAGSGKTEVVPQRLAQLLASGEDSAGIIAFTPTERAARQDRGSSCYGTSRSTSPRAPTRTSTVSPT